MGLSVETVSVYLLCCGLQDAQAPISRKNLMDVWNGTPDELDRAMTELEARRVIRKIISDQGENTVFQLIATDKWLCH